MVVAAVAEGAGGFCGLSPELTNRFRKTKHPRQKSPGTQLRPTPSQTAERPPRLPAPPPLERGLWCLQL